MRGRKLLYLGMVLGLAGLASALARNAIGWPEGALTLAGLGLFCLWGMRRGGSAGAGNALNAAAAIAYSFCFCLCLALLYLLARPRLPETDLTSARLNVLSGVSRGWLERLEQPIKLVAFLNDAEQIESFRDDMDRVREITKLVTYEIFDPLEDAMKAQEYAAGEKDSVFPGDVFVESGGKRRRFPMIGSRVPEGDFVNAMVAVTLQGPATVYFLTGHEEFSIVQDKQDPPSQARSVGVLRSLLERRGHEVQLLNLAVQGAVPEDALCVVSMGPESGLDAGEVEALRDYLARRGGRAILAAGTGDLGFQGSRLPGWGAIAKDFGVELIDAAVIDLEGKSRYGSEFVAAPTYGVRLRPVPSGGPGGQGNGSPAMRAELVPLAPNDPQYQGLYFERSRAMRVEPLPPPGVHASAHVYSSANSFQIPLEQFASPDTIRVSEGDAQPEPLIVLAERRHATGDPDLTGRLLILASPLPFTDALSLSVSMQLFLSSVESIAPDSRAGFLPIPKRELPDQILALTEEAYNFLLIFHVLFVPGCVFFCGLGLALAKRSRS